MNSFAFRQLFFQPSKYAEILRLAIPLVLASSGMVLMQFVDGMFLAWYSQMSIAAVGTAAMVSYTISSFVFGVVGYTSPYVANLLGAGKQQEVGRLIWQGIYIGLMAGALTLMMSPFSRNFFLLWGHSPELAAEEGTYLTIMLAGSVFQFVSVAVSGFFSGRGDNVRLMLAQFAGQGFNIIGDYALIFGKFGCPEMGIAGAAVATVGAAVVTLLILLLMMFRSRHNASYGVIKGWRFDRHLFRRLFAFGTASGLQLLIDATLWTFFLLLVGRIDAVSLAATSIGFRINMVAFQPVIGLGRAVASCIGRCHGALDHRGTVAYTTHCCMLCQIWMTVIAVSYFFFSTEYMEFFRSRDGQDYSAVMETGRNILYFMAFYSLADGLNMGMISALQAVGDTRWTAIVMGICTFILIASMCIGMHLQCGVYGLWTMATIFVVIMPIFWIFRFCGGRWQNIKVA